MKSGRGVDLIKIGSKRKESKMAKKKSLERNTWRKRVWEHKDQVWKVEKSSSEADAENETDAAAEETKRMRATKTTIRLNLNAHFIFISECNTINNKFN